MARTMNGHITNCPNCGAPIEHYYNYQCKYCKTFLHNTDEEIKKVNNSNIKVKRVEIERSPIDYTMMFTIYGVTFPKANWYEEGIGEIVISGDNVSLGHPIAYRIQIPLGFFYTNYHGGHIENILEMILDSLPPIFKQEEDSIIREIVEQLNPVERRLDI